MEPFDKKTYRPVTTLSLLSKVSEIRAIYEQASNYFEPFSMTFCVHLEKHIIRSMLNWNY